MQVYHPVTPQDGGEQNWSRRVQLGPLTCTLNQRLGKVAGALCAVFFLALVFMPRDHAAALLPPGAADESALEPPRDANITGESATLVEPADEFQPAESRATLPPVPMLPVRDSSPLKQLKCRPKACATPKHFGSLGNAYTMLSSTPGSGNTFLRSVVEEGTRLYSGSMYHDSDLKNDYGFKGETKNPWAGDHAQLSVIKTHYPFFHDRHIPAKANAAIHIVRAPFDALLSEFNREYGNSHVGRAPMEIMHSRLSGWLMKRHFVWTRTMRFWLGGNGSLELHPDVNNKVSAFVLERHLDPKGAGPAVPVLVMFYEDFVRDFEEACRALFTFLKTRLGNAMPAVEDAVACAVAGHEREQQALRARPAPYNPYKDSKANGIGQGMIDKWCTEFEKYWHPAKWGMCNAATLQVERGIPVRAQASVPEQACVV